MESFDETSFTGSVEEIIYQNDLNGYTVLDFDANGELITVVGIMPEVAVGDTLTVSGSFTMHATFGRQFKVTSFSHSLPETTEQIFKYLASGAIRGIGPKKATQIIEKFGSSALEVMENSPERLAAIRGISETQAKEIGEEFKRQYAVRTVLLKLERYGISASECIRIYNRLGINAVEAVENNPYALCELGIGISFEHAESIESKLEKKPDPNYRISEGVLYIMRHNALAQGHTCIPRNKILAPAAELLGISQDDADITVDSLLENGFLKSEMIGKKEFLFLPSSYDDEKHIAERIRIITSYPPPRSSTLKEMIDGIERENDIIYEDLQRTAIATAANKGLLILTGGPGTGKTTAIKGIIRMFQKQGLDISLAAPTGRAAKRMSELTGEDAKTIHRLLEVEWDESDKPVFRRDIKNPLECDALILDELSMVDIHLFSSLLDALPLGCRLVLVGDSDQLPAVGAGNVLHDLIESQRLPTVQLTHVFRQALESKIVENAHKIVNGEIPDLANESGRDFFHMERISPAAAADTVVELCSKRLPLAYKWDPFNDIQVICPSKKGETGTQNLNKLLQAALNPKSNDKPEIIISGTLFREGDKVMQIRNNYNIEWKSEVDKGTGIFNGDIGIIEKIDIKSGMAKINFDGRNVDLAAENLAEIELAYAVTVHKSQGSEFRAVILPAINVVPNLAYRNLLYTAVTRAKRMLVTVGSANTLEGMALNDRKARRYSALTHFLESEF